MKIRKKRSRLIVSAFCALAATIGPKTRPVVRGSFPAPPRRGSAPSRAEPHNCARTHAPADGPSRSFTHADRPFVVRDLTRSPRSAARLERTLLRRRRRRSICRGRADRASVPPLPEGTMPKRAAAEAPVKSEVKKAKKAATPKRSAGKPSGGSVASATSAGTTSSSAARPTARRSPDAERGRRHARRPGGRRPQSREEDEVQDEDQRSRRVRAREGRPAARPVHRPRAAWLLRGSDARVLWAVRRRDAAARYRGTRRRANRNTTRTASSSIPKSPRSSPRAWTTTCSSRAC